MAAQNRTTLQAAVRDADQLTQWVMQNYGERFDSAAELDELRGLFALLAYYLEAGHMVVDANEILKKKFGIFYYKTNLGKVEKSIGKNSPSVKRLLRRKERRNDIADELLRLTNRAGDSEVVTGVGVDCRTWVRDVLAGEDDAVLFGTKNKYSKELKTTALGRAGGAGAGVVVENRRFAETEGKPLGKYEPNQWPGLAVAIHRRLRALHGS